MIVLISPYLVLIFEAGSLTTIMGIMVLMVWQEGVTDFQTMLSGLVFHWEPS